MKRKKIHFVGIKGVGMTPLAIIAKEAKCVVSGSDIADSFITDDALEKAGITPYIGFSSEHVIGVDLVITTGAHGGFDNVEVQEAKKLGIRVLTQGQAVGAFMEGSILKKPFEGISVAGSHGKTTTTAMIATIFKENKLDPSYLIGTSSIKSLGQPGHFGKGKNFIAEADEYATEPNYDKTPKFLWQYPRIAIFTNIEFDHPDLYKSVTDITKVFLQFANQLPENGYLVACGDDKQVQEILHNYSGNHITYGYSPENDFVLKKVYISGSKTFFLVESGNATLGEFSLNVVGEHNALNAVAAMIVALECGLSLDQIKKGLHAFTGTKRRFEFIGNLQTGAYIFDDYGHHPTEIEKTLKAFKQSFPQSRIVCVFQPHTYSRTKSLFKEFSHAFSIADVVILTDIYPSLREVPDPTISSRLLVDQMHTFTKDVLYLPKAEDVVKYINSQNFLENTVIVTMGAGDIYKISLDLPLKKNYG